MAAGVGYCKLSYSSSNLFLVQALILLLTVLPSHGFAVSSNGATLIQADQRHEENRKTQHTYICRRWPLAGDIWYRVERVTNRERALDVLVFRNWSPTLKEYMDHHQHQKLLHRNSDDYNKDNDEKTLPKAGRGKTTRKKEEALLTLTRFYNDLGQQGTLTEPWIHFVCVIAHDSDDENKYVNDNDNSFTKRCNGVVATVDIQRKQQHHLHDSGAECSAALPSEFWYLKNMHVDISYRRVGMARAMIFAVQEYVKDQNDDDNKSSSTKRPGLPIYLQVDAGNHPAVALYESTGFVLVSNEAAGTDNQLMVYSDHMACNPC